MTGRTHDLAAFSLLVIAFVYWPTVPAMNLATAIAAFGANFIGGLFPDIDQPTSDFWDNFRLGPFIAKVICPALGGHRHISHSLVGLVLIGLIADGVIRLIDSLLTIEINADIVWIAFMIGVVSHLLTDLPTKQGLPLLWPLKWTFGIPPIRALRFESGKFVENLLIFPALLLLTGYLLYSHQDRVLDFLQSFR